MNAIPLGDGFTLEQAAPILGCTAEQVRQLIRAGELAAFNVGLGKQRKRWVVRANDLETFIQSRRAAQPTTAKRRQPEPSKRRRWI